MTILVNKTNRCTEFQFYWYYDSTCFRQSFCPSSVLLTCTSVLVHFMQIWWRFAIRSITFFSIPTQYRPKNVIFFLEFPISCSPLLLLQTACYLFLHISWIWLATTLASLLYNQTMFLSLLPTTMKTEAANSSTTLVFSHKRVCQNSEQPQQYTSW